MKVLVKILFIFTILFYIFHFLFFWVNQHVDTNFYHAFADYVGKGEYPFYFTYVYNRPLTSSPPLYSLLLTIIDKLNHSDILLHFIQIIMHGITSLLIFIILKNLINRTTASILALIYAMFPANAIFVSYVMTETGIQFLFMLYVYLLYRFIKTKNIQMISLSVFLGFIMGLWRYSFVIFGALSLILFIIQKSKKTAHYLFPAIGLLIIAGWVYINYQISGVWGISDYSNLRYNMVMMAEAGVAPPESDPSVIELRKYVPPWIDLRQPYWKFEEYIYEQTGPDLQMTNKLVGDVGKAAVKANPLAFAAITLKNYFQIHNGIYPTQTPYMENLSHFGIKEEGVDALRCFQLNNNFYYCNPIIMTPYSYKIWNSYIRLSDAFYKYLFPIWSIGIFFPAYIWCFIKNQKTSRLFAFLYTFGRLPVAMFTYPDARYLMPFYPLMFLITGIFLYDAAHWIHKISFAIRTHLNTNKESI
jgi:hypothetical protein